MPLIYLIIIIPFFISVKLNYNNTKKELCFSIYFLNLIKIIKGKIYINENGAIININNKNEKLSIQHLINAKNKSKPLKDYHFFNIKIDVIFGSDNDLIKSFALGFLFDMILAYAQNYFYYKKPYLIIEKNIKTIENSKVLNIDIKLKILMNLLMIIISLIKIIMEKIIYAKTNLRRQNKKYV